MSADIPSKYGPLRLPPLQGVARSSWPAAPGLQKKTWPSPVRKAGSETRSPLYFGVNFSCSPSIKQLFNLRRRAEGGGRVARDSSERGRRGPSVVRQPAEPRAPPPHPLTAFSPPLPSLATWSNVRKREASSELLIGRRDSVKRGAGCWGGGQSGTAAVLGKIQKGCTRVSARPPKRQNFKTIFFLHFFIYSFVPTVFWAKRENPIGFGLKCRGLPGRTR